MQTISHLNPKIAKIISINGLNMPNFRYAQITEAIYQKGIKSYSDILVLPKDIRSKIAESLQNDEVLSLNVVKELKGSQSLKVLFETKDGGQKIEAILMTYLPNAKRKSVHYSLCVSSQSGCALACTFCATGAIGLKKNLTAEEITDQVLYFKQQSLQIDSIVFMGMGEPFANPNIFDALAILTDSKMFAMSPRRISVSTVGIIPGIKRFISEFSEMNLVFSLHSPFESERLKLMPITKSYSIADCMKVVDEYVQATNNKVFIAYILLKGVNDSLKHAEALARLIKSQGSKSYLYHVNLIRFHPGSTLEIYQKPADSKVKDFMNYLTRHGISNSLRQSFGLDIDGACGQLYAEYTDKRQKIGIS